MRKRMVIEQTDDGGFVLTSDDVIGSGRLGIERSVEHVMDRVYEHFSGTGAAVERDKCRTIAREKHEAAVAAGRATRVNVTGPFPTATATAKRLGVSKDEAATLSKMADKAISSLSALNTMPKPASRAKSKAPRAKSKSLNTVTGKMER